MDESTPTPRPAPRYDPIFYDILEVLFPQRRCLVCGATLAPGHRTYCSASCWNYDQGDTP